MKKELDMETAEKIFVESFEDFSKCMLKILNRHKQYDRGELMEELINNVTMFAIHSQVRLGKDLERIMSDVGYMIEAAELKIKKDKMQ